MNISAINAELAKIGYKAVKLPRHNPAKAWKPQTPAGRTCKARMLMYASLPPVKGIWAYNEPGHFGSDGKWYSD